MSSFELTPETSCNVITCNLSKLQLRMWSVVYCKVLAVCTAVRHLYRARARATWRGSTAHARSTPYKLVLPRTSLLQCTRMQILSQLPSSSGKLCIMEFTEAVPVHSFFPSPLLGLSFQSETTCSWSWMGQAYSMGQSKSVSKNRLRIIPCVALLSIAKKQCGTFSIKLSTLWLKCE